MRRSGRHCPVVILLDTVPRHLLPEELYPLLAVATGVGQFERKAVRLGIWRLANDRKTAGHRVPRGNWCDGMSLHDKGAAQGDDAQKDLVDCCVALSPNAFASSPQARARTPPRLEPGRVPLPLHRLGAYASSSPARRVRLLVTCPLV